jgi:hypothetical protein
MLNSNFVITLVTILAALVCLFQGDIKEAYTKSEVNRYNPVKYGTPGNGLVKNGFSNWGGNGIQLSVTPEKKSFSCVGQDPSKFTKKIGIDFDKLAKLQPINKNLSTNNNKPRVVENYRTNVKNLPRNNMVEAKRSMQPLVGGPPRFITEDPKLNKVRARNVEMYAADVNNPIVDYGCGDVYSSTGQLLKKQTIRENYEDSQTQLPSCMTEICGEINGHGNQPTICDRLIYSSSKGKSGGDYFRGDLPINAIYYGNNDVYPDQSTDLRAGYFNSTYFTGVPLFAQAYGLQPEEVETDAMMHGRSEDIYVSYGTDVSAECNGL